MFNLKTGNNQIILTSELYHEKTSAQNGIESVKKNAGDDANYERKTSSKGEPYFVLKAANKQIIGKSEMYSSTSGMESGIASVKANASGATVVDLTEKENSKTFKDRLFQVACLALVVVNAGGGMGR